MFNLFTMKSGFVKSNYNNYLYFCGNSGESTVYLLIYVDHMLIACEYKDKWVKLKSLLKSEFNVKDLGSTSRILGMNINRD